MKISVLLIIDALINFLLGFLLMLSIPFSGQLTKFLGVPAIQNPFYPSLFGSVLIGIGIALIWEAKRKNNQKMIGLGLGGAIAINLIGGFTLIGWLIFGDLGLPLQGYVFLWLVAILLVGISSAEWISINMQQA
jgi:hypothetical protein